MTTAADKAGDEGLAELISHEQRGFRGILYAGVTVLLLMLLMSGALGAYLYVASQRLATVTDTLQRQAFDTRRRIDTQNNRIVAQEIALRRAYDEIRRAGGGDGVASAERATEALEAAQAYLLRGREPTLATEQAIRQLAEEPALTPEVRALLAGVAALLDHESRQGEIGAGGATLPQELTAALAQFAAAKPDPLLSQAATAGEGFVRFTVATATDWDPAACAEVFTAVDALRQASLPSPQPLYWGAQCERKLGMTREALADYARAVRASAAATAAPDASELTLAMNAYHGLGTTLIASFDVAESEAGITDALTVAREACVTEGAEAYAERSPRMQLALSCLDRAIALRRQLGQTENQLSGSGENKGFAHLRDGDDAAAFTHAVEVERTGLFAWNEAIRALAAQRVRDTTPAAARAALDAQRNVSLFSVGQFNLCELEALLSGEDFQDMLKLLAETHPGEEVRCLKG